MPRTTGTKQIRIGKVIRFTQELKRKEKFLAQLSAEATIPAKKAYFDGKLDQISEIIVLLEEEFGIGEKEDEGE